MDDLSEKLKGLSAEKLSELTMNVLSELKKGGIYSPIIIDNMEVMFKKKEAVEGVVSVIEEMSKKNVPFILSFNDVCYTIPFLLQTPKLLKIIGGIQIVDDNLPPEMCAKYVREQRIFHKNHSIIFMVHPLEYYMMKGLTIFDKIIFINEWRYSDIKRLSSDLKRFFKEYIEQMTAIVVHFTKAIKIGLFVTKDAYDSELSKAIKELHRIQERAKMLYT